MIETAQGSTPYTTDRVAELLGCCRSSTTRKIERLTGRILEAALAQPTAWAASGRPDRVSRALCEFVITAGAIAAGDPVTFQRWVRELLEANGGD